MKVRRYLYILRLYIAATGDDFDLYAFVEVFSVDFWWYVLAALFGMAMAKFTIQALLTRQKQPLRKRRSTKGAIRQISYMSTISKMANSI